MNEFSSSWIIDLQSPDVCEDIGGKARNLFRLRGMNFRVPEGIVLRAQAAREIVATIKSKELSKEQIATHFRNSDLYLEIVDEVKKALCRLPSPTEKYAFRSSARHEDQALASYAGQYLSVLDVEVRDVARVISDIWLSGFSEHYSIYQEVVDIQRDPLENFPSILIQPMVQCQKAGIAFAVDPVSGDWTQAVISAVPGHPLVLVSGEVTGQTWSVSREGRITGEPDNSSIMDRAELLEIAATIRDISGRLGFPQDIEWAMENGQLVILQTRPITTLKSMPEGNAEEVIWDNSNIGESYHGVTSPLTFSFAKKAYAGVYRQFCLMMGVPREVIKRNSPTFENMIGLIDGCIYYNLLNWYRILSMLPGYRWNQSFMEQMMGVKEKLSRSRSEEVKAISWKEKYSDLSRLFYSVGKLLFHYLTLERKIKEFRALLRDALQPPSIPFGQMSLSELLAYQRQLEDKLLTRWDAPLINDFFAMIFYGILSRRKRLNAGHAREFLYHQLLCARGGMISAEPVFEIRKITAEIRRVNPGLFDTLATANTPMIRMELSRYPEVNDLVEKYIARFGDRCLDELKLESPSLTEDPRPLWKTISSMGLNNADQGVASAPTSVQEPAEKSVVQGFLDKFIFRNTARLVCNRENLRFERTRLFGRARLVFMNMGYRLHGLGVLSSPEKVFYLEMDEIAGFVQGHIPSPDLEQIAEVRKRKFDQWRQAPPLPTRFKVKGSPFLSPRITPIPQENVPDTLQKRGLGSCPGVVRGIAQVISDPRSETLVKGNILIAQRTDPGWIVLYPLAKAIVTEYGSLLSHTAIVTRELSIPSVVGVSGLTGWIQTGDLIEINGAEGTVTKIKAGD